MSKKDHHIILKVIEAKGFNKDEECDSYIQVKVFDSSARLERNTLSRDTKLSKGGTMERDRRDSDKLSLASSTMTRRSSYVRAHGLELYAQEKSKTCFKTKNPWFDEEFEFELSDNFEEINVELFVKGLLKDKLVGNMVIPRMALDLDGRYHEDWYSLHASIDGDIEEKSKAHELSSVKLSVPQNCAKCHSMLMMAQAMKCAPCGQVYCMKCSASATSNCGILGLVRIKYLYIEEFLLPVTFYSKLMMNLLDEGFRMLQLLGRVTEEREELAKLCVTITENANLATKFLEAVAWKEIRGTQDPNTIFRANSLGSKAIDQYMKLVGMPYLKSVLQPVIKEIYTQNRPCELDPTRLDKDDDKEENFTVLEAYIKWTIDMILNSHRDCPPTFKVVFRCLRETAVAQFPNDPVIKYTVVTAFIFLRFFNAAILGPQLFGLSPDGDPPNARNSRTLTLISKTVQQLANMTSFDGKKEPFMEQLNHLVKDNIPRMQKFIDELCAPVSEAELAAFQKKKLKSGQAKGLGKIFAHFRSKQKTEEKELVIEKYFAAVHRHLMKYEEKMEQGAKEDEKADFNRLKDVLAEMIETYEKSTKEIRERRDLDIKNLSSEMLAPPA